tara:strand:- start:13706 stop:14059 length:354 start_codon:yes stop_codon:yes gene_type:complete
MSIKIQIIGSSIRATDLTEGKILFSEPARDTWYREDRLKAGVIQFYDDNSSRQTVGGLETIFLSEAIDENDQAFTEESFRLFVYNNIGFNPTVAINNLALRAVSLSGGFTVENLCYG